MAVQREATPVLFVGDGRRPRKAAIQKYQDIVAKGGWENRVGWP